jgi:hypothetical protein
VARVAAAAVAGLAGVGRNRHSEGGFARGKAEDRESEEGNAHTGLRR